MKTNSMGNSDLATSAIGFGCWALGGTYGKFDDSEVVDSIHRAIDLGVTLFDTARVYGYDSANQPDGAGRSEEYLGRALGARRKDVLIVTKGGNPTRPDQKRPRDASYASVIKDCELSLRALGTDYIDLYLMHWPDRTTPWEETMRAMNDLVASGKVRYLGGSNYRAADLREARKHAPIIANQVGYNMFDRRWEHEMFATAAELGVGVMAYGPLAHGLLTGNMTAQTTFETTDWRHKGTLGQGLGQYLFAPDHFAKNIAVVDQLKTVAARKGVSVARLALAWVAANPVVSVSLVGTRNVQEIEDNVRALDVQFTPAELAEIDTILKGASGQAGIDTLPQ
jgi:aryl-alcohol dehydrogenase-like predicted oxidoreductase